MGRNKKPVLTLDEHRALGAELWAARRRYDDLAADLSDRYPARVSEASHRVAQMIDTLRGVLDGLLFREQRGQDRSQLHAIYYPSSATTPPAGQPAAPVVPKQP